MKKTICTMILGLFPAELFDRKTDPHQQHNVALNPWFFPSIWIQPLKEATVQAIFPSLTSY